MVKILKNSHVPFILLQASAGYGKSLLIAQWLNHTREVGWLTLDELDNDIWRFMRYLVKAINDVTNNAANQTALQLQKSHTHTPLSILSLLLDELGTWRPVNQHPAYVVLDDYHLINNPEIDKALKLLIQHLPPSLTLIIASRTNPNLGIASLRTKRQLLELTATDMAFTAEELKQFLHTSLAEKLDQSTISALLKYTQGWPSAIQLIALQANHQFSAVSQFANEQSSFQPVFVWDYLAEEVFSTQSEVIQQFLLKTSIFHSFNGELAKAITGQANSVATIEYLTRSGLFITSLEKGWYKYHPLFLQFLTNQRQIQFGVDNQQLHQLASKAWLAIENPSKAIDHAIYADDRNLIRELIIHHGWSLFNRGEFTLLNQAIDIIEDEYLFREPQIGLLQAWLFQMQFRYLDVEALIKNILMESASKDIAIDTNLRGELNALLAQVAINKSHPQQARQLAESSLIHLDHASYRARLIATSVLGEVCHVEGSLNQALSLMQQTEKYARQHQYPHQVLWALIQQIEIHTALGNTQTAYDLQSNTEDYVNKQLMTHLPPYDFLLRLRAQLLFDWFRFNDAEQLIEQRLSKSKHISEYSHLPAILARIAILKGNFAKAEKLLGGLSLDLLAMQAHLDWQAEISFSLILLWQSQKNTSALRQWLNQATVPDTFTNHFTQQQGRNLVRVHISLNQYAEADNILNRLIQQADKHSLTSEYFKNQLLSAHFSQLRQQPASATQSLVKVLDLSLKTNYSGEFFFYQETLAPLLRALLTKTHQPAMTKHRIKTLLEQFSPENKEPDELNTELIEQLLRHEHLPEVLKSSPLTDREWQVLGLIYSGMTNEQIAYKIDVAPTTVKTHIRNLYQKLDIPNRKAAKHFTEQLVRLVYHR